MSITNNSLVPEIVNSSNEELLEVLNQNVKDKTHSNHVASTNNVNSVRTVSSNPKNSAEEKTSACAGSSSSKEDDWNTAQTILNILLKNPKRF